MATFNRVCDFFRAFKLTVFLVPRSFHVYACRVVSRPFPPMPCSGHNRASHEINASLRRSSARVHSRAASAAAATAVCANRVFHFRGCVIYRSLIDRRRRADCSENTGCREQFFFSPPAIAHSSINLRPIVARPGI